MVSSVAHPNFLDELLVKPPLILRRCCCVLINSFLTVSGLKTLVEDGALEISKIHSGNLVNHSGNNFWSCFLRAIPGILNTFPRKQSILNCREYSDFMFPLVKRRKQKYGKAKNSAVELCRRSLRMRELRTLVYTMTQHCRLRNSNFV